jgi:sulfite reductase (NADPH) hemoprotein beta-component
MYRYDEFDHTLVAERVEQFRDQVQRRLVGDLTEDEFKPLRLMNGLYLQLHAYMLRVAVPYGVLSSRQMRKLAHIARRYDKGYGHFTTRQNIQYNWPKLSEVPDLLAELAEVEMHAIQTSGNCIRNTTADQFAGVAGDEIEDPRIYAEIIRQWSTLHPEFSFLPRKFKIAVTGAPHDRAAIKTHDIGIAMVRNADGEIGFDIFVGGGQGRTPVVAKRVRGFLPKQHLLSYLEAILRVYNMLGQRSNIYKARIKILVNTVGIEAFTAMVEAEWQQLKDSALDLPETEVARIQAYFAPPAYEDLGDDDPVFFEKRLTDPAFARWLRTSLHPHKVPGYAIVTISLKPEGGIPGDASAEQMEAVADLADRYSFGELRVAHEQNLVLADVRQRDLYALWRELQRHDLATPNVGLISDIIACPGLDYCNLANARSIPIAQRISRRFADLDRQHDIGRITLNISGCINACGHHHVGNIGILGVDKKGTEFYQVTLGGSADENTSVGAIVGPAFDEHHIVDAVETVVGTYLEIRKTGESFIDTYRRVGLAPFKETLYATH